MFSASLENPPRPFQHCYSIDLRVVIVFKVFKKVIWQLNVQCACNAGKWCSYLESLIMECCFICLLILQSCKKKKSYSLDQSIRWFSKARLCRIQCLCWNYAIDTFLPLSVNPFHCNIWKGHKMIQLYSLLTLFVVVILKVEQEN